MNGGIKLFGTILALLVMVGANPLIHAVIEVRQQLPLYKDCNTGVVSNKPIVKNKTGSAGVQSIIQNSSLLMGSRIASPSSTNHTPAHTKKLSEMTLEELKQFVSSHGANPEKNNAELQKQINLAHFYIVQKMREPIGNHRESQRPSPPAALDQLDFSLMTLEELKQFLIAADYANPAMSPYIMKADNCLKEKIALMTPAEQVAFKKSVHKELQEKKRQANEPSSVLSHVSTTLSAVAMFTYFIAPAVSTLWSKVVSPSLGFIANNAVYPVTGYVGSKLFAPTVVTEEMMLAEKKAQEVRAAREAAALVAQQAHEKLMHNVGEKTGTNAVFNYFSEKTPQVLYTTSSLLAGVAITAALKKAGDITGVSKAVEKAVYGDDEQKMDDYAAKKIQYRHDLEAYKAAIAQGDTIVTEPEEPAMPLLAMAKARVLPIASLVAQVMLYSHAVSPLVNGTFAYLFA